MNRIHKQASLCFDDILLVPQYSEVESRHSIDINVTDFRGAPINIGGRTMQLPIFASPMDTVVDIRSAQIMVSSGVCPILHRYCTIEEQVTTYLEVASVPGAPIAAAIGASGDFEDRACALYDAGVRILCLDVAHGHHVLVKDALKTLRDIFGDDIHLMAGNVATLQGFEDLISWGANFVRCGVGGGAVCSTRIVTGHGVPTMQTILDCAETSKPLGYIVADGGIRTSGDIVKAFAGGADFVMLGSMLACHTESPGEERAGYREVYKNYRGMASKSAQYDWRGEVSVAEGVNSWHKVKGNLGETIGEIVAGIKSGLSYSGVASLSDFMAHVEIRRVSPNVVNENQPHAIGAEFVQ